MTAVAELASTPLATPVSTGTRRPRTTDVMANGSAEFTRMCLAAVKVAPGNTADAILWNTPSAGMLAVNGAEDSTPLGSRRWIVTVIAVLFGFAMLISVSGATTGRT